MILVSGNNSKLTQHVVTQIISDKNFRSIVYGDSKPRNDVDVDVSFINLIRHE